MKTNENDIALRPVDVFHHAEDFNVHGLWFDALKNGIGDATHASVDLINRNGFKRFRALSCKCGGRQQTAEGGKRENCFSH